MSDTPDTPAEGVTAEQSEKPADKAPQPRLSAPLQFEVDWSTIQERSRRKATGIAESEAERVELEGRRTFFRLRTTWSRWIITWITILILFNVALTVLVGSGRLDFANYQWFVTAVTVETFLQIVGMGYIAVRFLFSDGKHGS